MTCRSVPLDNEAMESICFNGFTANNFGVHQGRTLQRLPVTPQMWLEQDSTQLGHMKPLYRLSSCRKVCVEFRVHTSSVVLQQ